MKLADIRKKTEADLRSEADKLKQQIAEFRTDKVTNNSETNKHKLKNMKRQLAQILTVANEKKTTADKETK